MFDQIMTDTEKNLETSTQLFSLLKNQFEEHKDSLIKVMEDWDKFRAQLVQLGEVIELYCWEEDRLIEMMTQLQQDLVEKEESLEKLQ
jgi:hypothetical protein